MAEPTHGKVILTLDEYRLSRNISKNKIGLIHHTEKTDDLSKDLDLVKNDRIH